MDLLLKNEEQSKEIQITTNEHLDAHKEQDDAFRPGVEQEEQENGYERAGSEDFSVVTKDEIERLGTEDETEREEKLVKHELRQSSVIDIKDTPEFKNMELYEPDELEKAIAEKHKNEKIERTWREPRYVGLDKKYSGEKRDDSARMARIKNRLNDYFAIVENRKKGDEVAALSKIVQSCDNYLHLRYRKVPMMLLTAWRFPKFCVRWHEVRMLRKKAKERIAELTRNNVNPFLIHERLGQVYLGHAGALVGAPWALVRFLVENPIRLVLKVLTVPVWAANEGIRKIVKWRGGIPPRHIKFPGVYWLREYMNRNDAFLSPSGTNARIDEHAGRGQHWYDRFFVDYHTKDQDIIDRAQLDMDMAEFDYDEENLPDAWDGYAKYAKPVSKKKQRELEESLIDRKRMEISDIAARNIQTMDMNIANKEMQKIVSQKNKEEEQIRKQEEKAEKLQLQFDEEQKKLQEIKTTQGAKAYYAELNKLQPIRKQRAADSGLFDFVEDHVKLESLNPADYTDEERIRYEKVLTEKGYPIGKTHGANNFYRKQLIYYSKLADEFVWKEGTDQAVKDAYNWLGRYYSLRDRTRKEKPSYDKKLEMPKYKKVLSDYKQIHREYEKQDRGSNNCFACAGAELYRHYCRVNNRDDENVNQYSVLDYKPDFKNYKDYEKTISEIDPETTPEVFGNYQNEVKSYLVGKGNIGDVGNIFEIGDFFIGRQKDAMLNKSTYVIPAYSDSWDKARKNQFWIDLNNRQVLFLKRVKEGLDANSPVALLTDNPKHYTTIIGINGTKLKLVDSLSSNRGSIMEMEIGDIMPACYDAQIAEIVWMSKVKPVEELKKDYRSLSYDPEKGFSNTNPLIEELTNVAQTKGVMVTKDYEDMEVYVDGVRDCAYLPKDYKATGE